MSIEEAADEYFNQTMRYEDKEDHAKAIECLECALSIEPKHNQALVALGDIYTLHGTEIGLSEEDACKIALTYFDRMLDMEPRHAETWASKGLALLYLHQPEEALFAAEQGIKVLPERIGYGMTFATIYINTVEALYHRKICALIELDRKVEARAVFDDIIAQYPDSIYLNWMRRRF